MRTIEMPREPKEGFLSEWPWWLAPALLALTLTLYFVDPFIGDWDGLDYTVLALQGKPSSMLFGRALFTFYNHALWLVAHALFNLPADKAYLIFKYAVVIESPLAVIVWWLLARDLTESAEAATISALVLALSAFFILYGGQVMTEIPSILLLGIALLVHLRGLRRQSVWLLMLGAALLGLSVNLREVVGVYALWLVLAPVACGYRLGRRQIALIALSCLVFTVFALGGFALFYLADVDNYRWGWHGWVISMREESARHPVTLWNLRPLIWYFILSAPVAAVALPLALVKEWRAHRFSPLFALAVIGVFADLLLFFNYSTTINWRYLLTGLPAIAPLIGSYLMNAQMALLGNLRRAFITNVIGVILATTLFNVSFWPVSYSYVKYRALAKDYKERLRLLPDDAVVMAGGQTVGVNYWRGIGAGRWDTIGTGGGWPGEAVSAEIEKYLSSGRRVFVDTDKRWWTPCGWQVEEVRQLASLETRFRFRRVSETIFEIRPLSDVSAQDAPHLEQLLPEHRAEELKYCTG